MTGTVDLPIVDDDPSSNPDFLVQGTDEIAVTLCPGAPDRHPKFGRPSRTSIYTDQNGNPSAMVYRFDQTDGQKEIRPYDLRAKSWSAPKLRFPYQVQNLFTTFKATVIVVEGEKAADALQLALPDCVVTTSMGGANAAGKTIWRPLKDRNVIIWPDADEPGFGYAEQVCEKLKDLAKSVRVIPMKNVDGLKDLVANAGLGIENFSPSKGWDAADAVGEGWNAEILSRFLSLAVPFDSSILRPTSSAAGCTRR